jgi:DivIVA domain-containing protein
MPVTPADIHNVEFAKASLGRRGYDEEDVDSLLDEAIQEMVRLMDENDALQGTLDELPSRVTRDTSGRTADAEISAATADLDRAHIAREHADHDARLARRQLDEAYRAAMAGAVPDHGTAREHVLEMARRTADEHLRDARRKAGELLAEARERAGRTAHEAQQLVDTIELRSHRRQEEATADLTVRRAGLQRDVDELTRFAAGYQSALERHLRRQGELMDGPPAPALPSGNDGPGQTGALGLPLVRLGRHQRQTNP